MDVEACSMNDGVQTRMASSIRRRGSLSMLSMLESGGRRRRGGFSSQGEEPADDEDKARDGSMDREAPA